MNFKKKVLAGISLGTGMNFNNPQTNAIDSKVGADFILTGVINKLEPRETKNIIDGSEIKSSRKRFKYEANIRIIDVVSGQVKFAVKSKNTKQLISKIT